MNAVITPTEDTGKLKLRIETEEYIFEEFDVE